MSMLHFSNVEPLDSPQKLKKNLPVTNAHLEFITHTRNQISQILEGLDPRLLLIVGPCSIHDENSAKEYALKLRKLTHEISDSFLVIMRTYFEKPRSSIGWKGMLYDPYLNNSNDLASGIYFTRKLLLELAEMEVPTATEFLDPLTYHYIGDLISWGCIGARTAESQIHRQLASGLNMPIAFKNSTSGNIDIAVKGALVASFPHTFLGINDEGHVSVIRTPGNPYTHIALRGGNSQPNYDASSIASALNQLKQAQLPARVIIDCSHDNSPHQYMEQHQVFKSVLEQYVQGNTAIRGLALESHLCPGNQTLNPDKSKLRYDVSLTDPCIDWDDTEQLILWGDAILKSSLIATT